MTDMAKYASDYKSTTTADIENWKGPLSIAANSNAWIMMINNGS